MPFFTSGSAEARLEGERRTLAQDDLLLVNLNKRHSLDIQGDSLACRLLVPYALLRRCVDREHILFWCDSTVESDENHSSLRILLRQMLNCLIACPDGPNLMLTSCFYELLHCLTEHFLVDSGMARFRTEESRFEARMNEIVSFIEAHYAEHISLNDLADHVFLTYSYLSRHFKKVFGMNFLEYLNRTRLRHAVEDLLNTDAPVTRIAVDNGFVNVSGLNKAFKDAYQIQTILTGEQKTLSFFVLPDAVARERAQAGQKNAVDQHKQKVSPGGEKTYNGTIQRWAEGSPLGPLRARNDRKGCEP